jgi:hypothetical protein
MRFVTGLALAGAAFLAACGSSETARQAPCPRITLLREGADLTRFRPGAGQDLSVMAYDARIAGFDARCDFADRGRNVTVDITPRFELERGPAAGGAPADLNWFVSVSDAADSQILDQVDFTTRAAFQANVSRGSVPGERVRLTIPNGEGQGAGSYNVRISFRLTPDELAYNRRRGMR